jgi:hypothetical protein
MAKSDTKSQIEKFRDAARKQAANENEDAFDAALRAITTGKGIGPATERLAEELGQTDPSWTKHGKRKRTPG